MRLVVMDRSRPNLEEVLAYLEAEMDEYNQQFYTEPDRNNQVVSSMNRDLVERYELGTNEEYSQELDAELELK
jgi:predicted  nucleic acid-binding Zn-ribbon protein